MNQRELTTKMKADGMTHKVKARMELSEHEEAAPDKFDIVLYFGERPTEKHVKEKAKGLGNLVSFSVSTI